MSSNQVHILYFEIELFIPYAHSLKEKRQVIRAARDLLANQFNVAIAEVGRQSDWQRSVVGGVSLSIDKATLDKLSTQIEVLILERIDAELIRFEREWL